MYVSRDRLFVLTVCFTVLMTILFAGALIYDLLNYRGSGPTAVRTVTSTDVSPVAGASGSGGGTTTHGGSSGSGSGGSGASGSASTSLIAPGAPITIGALITQSGPLDASDAFRADEAYVQSVNSQGGINGHKLVLDVKDDQGNPAVGRPGFEQIVQEDHALALVGECAPVTDAAIVAEINQSQVPIINDCLTSAGAYSSPYIWFTTVQPTTWQSISATYIWTHQNDLKMHKPYVLCVNSSVTLPYCDGFVNSWKAHGGTICSQGKCGPNQGYQTEEIATTEAAYQFQVIPQIKSSGADSIVALLEPTNQAALLKALASQNMKPSDGWPDYAPLGMDPSSISAGGAAAVGVHVNTADSYFPSENTPGIQQLAAALHRYQPDTPVDNYSLSIGWTPMEIFGEALRRVGPNVSRQALINALNSMGGYDTQGLNRPLTWTATNRLAPSFTRWATVQGPTSYNVTTGWIDANGNPAP